MDDHIVLMDKERIHRSVRRMAHEVIETNHKDIPILLFGIEQRGSAVAKLLRKVLTDVWSGEIVMLSLPFEEENPKEVLDSLPADQKAENLFPLVVDDVIFSGETMFQALRNIALHIPLEEIYTAALVDRGHRKFPIRAEFYGMQLPTKLNEHVSVIVDGEKVQQVELQNSL